MSDSQSAIYFRQLCENLGTALIATDDSLNISLWNAAASRMFGAAAERMIGTPVAAVIPQDRRPLATRMLQRTLSTGEVIELEFEHRDGRGRTRELAATIAPIMSGDGQRIGVSVCIRDITRRLRLAKEVHQHRKMASLGEMAGAVAHHFNNILGGMVTSVDFALASDNPAVTHRVLQQLGKALSRVSGLVSGLLAFAEGDRRAEDLSDFTEVIFQLAEEIEAQIEDKRITFALNLPEFPVLPVARVQVLTILRNVAQNAIEAMPEGGALRIDVERTETDLVVRITDSGAGLDEEAKSRIFEPFYTTKGVLASGAGRATGLGLAVALGLAQRIGATIAVSSEPDQGACFTIVIPVAESAE